MKAMVIKVKEEMCFMGNIEAMLPMGRDFPNCHNTFMKCKETSEDEVK